MKAIIQDHYGSPDFLTLREVPAPVPGDDQVLVRVHAASVNALDWGLMKRLPHLAGRLMRLPQSRVPGIDVAGRIEAVGKSTTRFKPGDEVFGGALGAFAEFAVARENRLALKPGNLSFVEAAALPIAGCTALQGLRDTAGLKSGESILVYGAGGGVGTFAVLIAKALGARVTAVTSTRNLERMRSLGADAVMDYTKDDFTASGQRYDVLFDIGADRSFADCRRTLAPGGRWIFGGAPASPWALLTRMLKARLASRKRGRPQMYMAKLNAEDLVVLKELSEAGRLAQVIDREYPLSEAADAIRYLGTRQVRGKVVIKVS